MKCSKGKCEVLHLGWTELGEHLQLLANKIKPRVGAGIALTLSFRILSTERTLLSFHTGFVYEKMEIRIDMCDPSTPPSPLRAMEQQ